jgi:hypothetical protein
MNLHHQNRLVSSSALLAGFIAPLVLAGCGAPDPTAGEPVPSTADEQPAIHALAFPGRTGETLQGVFQTPYGDQELTYQSIDGVPVFEGDIILNPAKPDYRSAGVSALGARWPNGIVPVESTGLFNDARVTQAIQHWQERTGLRFQFGATTGNRVRFVAPTNNAQCDSFVGMVGGQQTINIGAFCSTGNTIHEIGHAIGLFHEQSRTDRDTFVTVIPNCIQSGQSGNFAQFGSNGLNLGPYDIGSIMHYGSTFFLDTTVPGCTATITRADGTPIAAQSNVLSGGDIAGAQSLYLAWTLRSRAMDWDLDGRADLAVWRPGDATWFILNSNDNTFTSRQWGAQTDVPVPGDYDDDFKGDFAVWRPSTGEWFVINSRTNQSVTTEWGVSTDVPVQGDYNGDGSLERAVWRPLEGNWYIRFSNGSFSVTQWGAPGDIPVPSDYDADGITDLAVWRPSNGTWFIISSRTGGVIQTQWGAAGDIPVPADYDGDGASDITVWRPSDTNWYTIRSSSGSSTVQQWGASTDTPVPGDYDGDGKADVAVWRPSNGNWFVIRSSNGTFFTQEWGIAGDAPVP